MIITEQVEPFSDRTSGQLRPQLHALMAEKGISEEETVAEFKMHRTAGRHPS